MKAFDQLGPPEKILILPPLAIARLGGSDQPLEAFAWGANDLSPNGTAKTTILPQLSLVFTDDHAVETYMPDTVTFKDENGIRPVCPFFELHGVWNPSTGQIIRPIDSTMIDPEQINWTVKVANRKAAGLTREPALAVTASISAPASLYGWHELVGSCDRSVEQPLFDLGHGIPLGKVRLGRPSSDLPGYRLRFYPAKGYFYGPSDLKTRWNVNIPEERLFLNPNSAWCGWNQRDHPARATPTGQYAADAQGRSYGLIDDVCDGIVSCSIAGYPDLSARARIVVAPPDFAPDRRPIVSVADGLTDRQQRGGLASPGFTDADDQLESEVLDLLERAFENAGLMNMDWIAEYFGPLNIQESARLDIDYDPSIFFQFGVPHPDGELPLSSAARQHHRRLVVRRILRDTLSRDPDFITRMVRDPQSRNTMINRKMPALMRGADGRSLHLTERQYGMLQRYVSILNGRSAPPGGG